MNASTLKQKLLLFPFLLVLLFLTCNYDFESVNQPDIANSNSTFEVTITVRLDAEERGGIPYFGIRLPIGWTVIDSISFSGVLNGMFIFSEEQSDTMEIIDAAPEGYYWWVSVGDTVDSLLDGTVSILAKIQTDDQKGLFYIDYMLGDSSSGLNFRRDDHHPISVGLPISVTVTNTNDSGPGSLRQAITEVRIGGEILFDLSYPAKIILESQLIIDRDININGPETGELTISGNDKDRVIFIQEHLEINISNLIISNGSASGESPEGGGIYCKSSNLSLTNAIIRNNSAAELGGGIYCSESDMILTNVVIAKNNAENGGGICCSQSMAILNNVSITENSSLINGGGIFCRWAGYTSLMNTIIWNNSPESIHLFYGSIKAIYCDIQDVLVGDSNIDADPLFADTIHYYLSKNSPCIDSGDPDALFNDQENPTNPGSALWPALGALRNDIGAYGGHGKFKKIPMDILPNGSIGDSDFIDGQVGWLNAGQYGDEKFIKTENGGQTWETIPIPLRVIGFDFIDENIGWVLGEHNDEGAVLIKTVDGGQNWVTQRTFPDNISVSSGQAVNDLVAYLVTIINDAESFYGRIIKTLDGGNNWIDVSPDNDNWEDGLISFFDNNIGIVSVQNGDWRCFFRTIDGGLTWHNMSCSESTYINSIQSVDDSSGYFTSDNKILFKTTDKYIIWNKILDGVTAYSAIGKNSIFAIIDNQKFVKSLDGGNTWKGIHLGKDVFETVKFVDNSTGWIVGHNGSILKTTDGGESWSNKTPDIFTSIITEENEFRKLPMHYILSQNYPNPFNPSTKIKFSLPKPEIVKIRIYNTLGQRVETLINESMIAGHHEVEFNALNLSSGVYYYRIEAGEFHQVKKMILLR